MKRLFFAALAFSGTAAAQVSDYQNLMLALERAQSRVLIFAPSIYDVQLGEAIRRARLDPIRKVSVRVLAVPYYDYQPKSVMLSLALAGVPVYEAQVTSTKGLIIVDDQGWRGDYLGRFSDTPLTPLTAGEINTALKWFKGALGKADMLTQIEAFDRLKKVTP